MGSSLVAGWLGLRAFTATAWVQSPVRKLGSHKIPGKAKKKKKNPKKPNSGVMSLEIRLKSTRLGELTQKEKVERKEEGSPSKD